MNLFGGMTNPQILSAVVMIGVFTVYATLVIVAMAALYITSRPRSGRVRSGAGWQVGALVALFWAIVATVWAAPAENTFVTPAGGFYDLSYGRSLAITFSAACALVGFICIVVGWAASSARNRQERQDALTV